MKILFRVLAEAKRYKGLLIIAVTSTLMITAINLTAPLLMSEMTALAANELDIAGLHRIWRLAFGLLCLYLLRVLFRYLSSYMSHKAAWNLVKELRVKVYLKLQSLPISYYRANESGDLVSRTVNDTATFEALYAHLLPESVTNAITVTGVTVILLLINPKLALITCIPIPFILLSGWIFVTKVRPYFRKAQRSLGSFSAQLQDNFSGMQEIQAFGRQAPVAEAVEDRAGDYSRNILHALRHSAVFHPTVELLTSLGSVFVVGFGGYFAYTSKLQVGDIVAFMLYLTLFYAPVTGLANLMEQVQQALAGAERVIEVLDAPEVIMNAPGAPPLENPRGALRFKDVSFSYTDGVPVLEHVSFEAQPGDMIAIVGATGVGKSTLAQLVARFYDPVSGAVEMDGRNLKDVELDSVRRNVAMVLQDTFLFNGTISDNISFARPDASLRDIEKAARIARIHDDIMEMPDGYQTVVGERGARLSGGQKQRIAIARAVLCDAPTLVLDEATASVDVRTEANIQKAILDLAGTRTIIVIAHRLSTVRRATRILVFEEGRIIQNGTHEELIAVPGLYREMCRVQEQGEQLV